VAARVRNFRSGIQIGAFAEIQGQNVPHSSDRPERIKLNARGSDSSTIHSPRRDVHDKFEPLGGIRLLAFSMLLSLFPATSWAQQRPPIAEQMAKTYGLDSFGQIEGIRYTFNAELPGVELSRTWEWNPKTDTVCYEGKDKESKPIKATYSGRSSATKATP
jgi:hypothetical protein